ncbi:MAG: prepilin-type N-terminal cleavage/methylation domain-containing protein [Pseudoxanthomonas sp.]|jgi:general secretion pathway protein J|nr:prepilin-type N-terminal cleavage/methylation domain-containing protein [Pseudoxanthomonas sp.]
MRKAAGGFTLLELLITMVIGGVLVYMTTEVLSLIQRGVRQSRMAAGDVMAQQRAIAVVKAAILNAIPPATAADEWHRVVATGSAFEFAAVPADSQVKAGVVRARLVIEPADAGMFAVAFEQRGQGGIASTQILTSRLIVLKDVASASLEYLYRTPLGLRPNATQPGHLPELVTLKWVKTSRDGKAGSLSARPRLDAGANCRLDFQSLSCRYVEYEGSSSASY